MVLDLYKRLYLCRSLDKIYIQPANNPTEVLIIDRSTGEINIDRPLSEEFIGSRTAVSLIYGLIGVKQLIKGPYLIVITKATPIGQISSETIYRMDEAQVIPFRLEQQPLRTANQDGVDLDQHWNDIYVQMLESILKVPYYYFSYSYDLTNTIQRSSGLRRQGDKYDRRCFQQNCYDIRFLWNHHLMSAFDKCGEPVDRYRLPFILGYVSINDLHIDGRFSWTLISRRSVRNAGTRYNRRGTDANGNVANFVETEQIVEQPPDGISSFVQVRGSIPLMWSQTPGIQYKPVVKLEEGVKHEVPMRKHFDELKYHYDRVSVVCLIDSKGHEAKLQAEFTKRMDQLQESYYIPYHYFDFHKECSKMRWYNLEILIDGIQEEIEDYGFFSAIRGETTQIQSGVIRSNCIDSLDRTNVVQSLIAHEMVQKQRQKISYIVQLFKLTNNSAFMHIFKNAWADNADCLSIQYSGTPAMKTDFTRGGRRTYAGKVRDGVNSMTRYFNGNFSDQFRQDAIDLFLGQFEGYPSPLYRPMDLISYSSPLPVTVIMLTLLILYFYLRN